MTRVFVYGTLKSGFPNHRIMENAKATFVGKSHIGYFQMYTLGPFPAVVPCKKQSMVFGEVYDVEDIRPLDMLEGYPDFYDRVQVETAYGPAWVYFHHEVPVHSKLMINGEW